MKKTLQLQTPLGPILATGDNQVLYEIKYAYHGEKIENPGYTEPLRMIEKEFAEYFKGNLMHFQTPLHYSGSPFEMQVWEQLQKIPFGSTCSYADLAKAIGKEGASRAVGNANGKNPLAIIIPCHRVIYADGSLGGYRDGLQRKQWLLNLESQAKNHLLASATSSHKAHL